MLLDLGGVLVQFDGLRDLRRLLAGRPSLEEATERWLTCGAVRAFERGEHSDPARFARETVRELELPLAAEDFLAQFERWVPRALPGAANLLQELQRRPDHGAPRPLLGCLSNTNPLHAARFHEWFPDAFDRLFFSFQSGRVKPDRETFEAVSSDLALAPEQIWFGDDAQLNVQAARALGWRAECVRSPAEVAQALRHLGVLGSFSP